MPWVGSGTRVGPGAWRASHAPGFVVRGVMNPGRLVVAAQASELVGRPAQSEPYKSQLLGTAQPGGAPDFLGQQRQEKI